MSEQVRVAIGLGVMSVVLGLALMITVDKLYEYFHLPTGFKDCVPIYAYEDDEISNERK